MCWAQLRKLQTHGSSKEEQGCEAAEPSAKVSEGVSSPWGKKGQSPDVGRAAAKKPQRCNGWQRSRDGAPGCENWSIGCGQQSRMEQLLQHLSARPHGEPRVLELSDVMFALLSSDQFMVHCWRTLKRFLKD